MTRFPRSGEGYLRPAGPLPHSLPDTPVDVGDFYA
jgi:hypothetical protein